jgi:hypothetical protein
MAIFFPKENLVQERRDDDLVGEDDDLVDEGEDDDLVEVEERVLVVAKLLSELQLDAARDLPVDEKKLQKHTKYQIASRKKALYR